MRNIKVITSLFLLSVVIINCKSNDATVDFKQLTETYFKEKNALNPLDATQNGQNDYNDQLQF